MTAIDPKDTTNLEARIAALMAASADIDAGIVAAATLRDAAAGLVSGLRTLAVAHGKLVRSTDREDSAEEIAGHISHAEGRVADTAEHLRRLGEAQDSIAALLAGGAGARMDAVLALAPEPEPEPED